MSYIAVDEFMAHPRLTWNYIGTDVLPFADTSQVHRRDSVQRIDGIRVAESTEPGGEALEQRYRRLVGHGPGHQVGEH